AFRMVPSMEESGPTNTCSVVMETPATNTATLTPTFQWTPTGTPTSSPTVTPTLERMGSRSGVQQAPTNSPTDTPTIQPYWPQGPLAATATAVAGLIVRSSAVGGGGPVCGADTSRKLDLMV